MPVYDYKCTECGKTYDVYHKSREVEEDIVCPVCGSMGHKKMMSVSAISMGSSSASGSCSESHTCAGGSCCGGACGIN